MAAAAPRLGQAGKTGLAVVVGSYCLRAVGFVLVENAVQEIWVKCMTLKDGWKCLRYVECKYITMK